MLMGIKFGNIRIENDQNSYRKSFLSYDRKFNAVCISAEPLNDEESLVKYQIKWIDDYEKQMINVVLNRSHIEPLYKSFVYNKKIHNRNLVVFFIKCISFE